VHSRKQALERHSGYISILTLARIGQGKESTHSKRTPLDCIKNVLGIRPAVHGVSSQKMAAVHVGLN